MSYKVADGLNVALGSLVDVDPQPRSSGIRPTRRTFGADGTVLDEGKYVELEFNVMPDTATYQSILNQFGVDTALTNDVTVYVRDEQFNFVRMNGTAIRPEPGRDVQQRDFFLRNVTLLIRNLVAST